MNNKEVNYNRNPINIFDVIGIQVYEGDSHTTQELVFENIFFNKLVSTTTTNYDYVSGKFSVMITSDFRNLSIIGLEHSLKVNSKILLIEVILKNGFSLFYDLTGLYVRNNSINLSGYINIFRTFIEENIPNLAGRDLPLSNLFVDYNYFRDQKLNIKNQNYYPNFFNSSNWALITKDPKFVSEILFNGYYTTNTETSIPYLIENSTLDPINVLTFTGNAINNKTNLTNLYAVVVLPDTNFITENNIWFFPLFTEEGIVAVINNGAVQYTSSGNTLPNFLKSLSSSLNTNLTNGFIGIYQLDNAILANMGAYDPYNSFGNYIIKNANGDFPIIGYKFKSNIFNVYRYTTPKIEHETLNYAFNNSKIPVSIWEKKYLNINLNDSNISKQERFFSFYILLDKIYLVKYSGKESGFEILSSIEKIEIQNIDQIKELQKNNISFQNSIINTKINNNFEKKQVENDQLKNNIGLGIDLAANVAKTAASAFSFENVFLKGGEATITSVANIAKNANELAFNNINAGLAQEKIRNSLGEKIRDNQAAKKLIVANNNFSVNNSIENIVKSLTQKPLFNFSDIESWNNTNEAIINARNYNFLRGVYVGNSTLISYDFIDQELTPKDIIIEKGIGLGGEIPNSWSQIFSIPIYYFYFWNWEQAFLIFKRAYLSDLYSTSQSYLFQIFENDIKLLFQNGFTYPKLDNYDALINGSTSYRVRKQGE